MDVPQAAHPAHDHLKAFGLGESLDATSAETIEQHLETCEDCRRVVAELSADGFLGRLRAARNPDSTPTPERPLEGIARSITQPPTPTSSTTGSDTLPPELVDHPDYEVVRELGRGGMGVVYLARNRLMDRPEVLKVMSKDLVNKPGAADRFLRELRSAARLGHPNVVRAYSAGWLGDALMFAMEYVEGDDLAGLVKARGRLPVLNACYYTQQTAAGLQHAHEMDMVHRDVKPANLILTRSGKKHTVKILDFGLAKVKGERTEDVNLTGVGAMMGTPSYMAPEQWRDAASADIRADIYSLGCTLYFLLTGNPPFTGNWQGLLWKHQNEEPEPLNKVRPEVSEALAVVVAKMMAKDPMARYQTPAEVVKALAPFVRPGATSKPTPEATPVAPAASATDPDSPPAWETFAEVSLVPATAPAPPPPKRRRWWPVVACGAVLAALLVAWAGGAFKVKTKDGTIVLENLPPDAEVLVDGETVTVARNGEQATISLNRDGPHKLKVLQGGREVFASDLTVKVGGEPVRVSLEPPRAGTGPEPAPIPPLDPKLILADGNRRGVWKVVGAELVQESASEDTHLGFGDSSWSDYDFSCEVKAERGVGEVQLKYRVTRTGSEVFGIGGWNNTLDFATSFEPGKEGNQRKSPSRGVQKDRWYKMHVRLRGAVCECYCDGQLLFRYSDSKNREGAVGLGTQVTVARFRNIRVTDPSGKVLFDGLQRPSPAAEQPDPAALAALTGKKPVPSATRLAVLQRAARDGIKSELASGKPDDLSRAAQSFLTRADSLHRPDEKFALLDLARDLTAQAGKLNEALDLCARLDREYLIDPLAVKVRTLQQVARTGVPRDGERRLRLATLTAGYESLAADNFASGRDAAKLAAELPAPKDGARAAYVASFLNDELARAESAHARLPAAARTADTVTNDPAVNTARGLYLGLVKHDWAKGLDFLRAGAEPWRDIAEREGKKPTWIAERTALGDLWWKAAEAMHPEDAAAARRRARYWYLGALGRMSLVEREEVAPRLLPRIDQVPRSPVTLSVRLTGLSGYHSLRISSDGVRTVHRGSRKTTGDIWVNHLHWTDNVSGHVNSGATRLLPDGIDFSTTQLVRMSHSRWGAIYPTVTPEYVELQFWHAPVNDKSEFEVLLMIESAGFDLPSRFARQWDVAYYNFAEKAAPAGEKARAALFDGEPTARAKLNTINFMSMSSPTDEYRPGGPPSKKVTPNNFAMVGTTIWKLPAGRYRVRTFADDGVRVLIDDKVVLDHWRPKTGDWHAASGDFPLSAGDHRIRVEYLQYAGPAFLQFDLVRVGD